MGIFELGGGRVLAKWVIMATSNQAPLLLLSQLPSWVQRSCSHTPYMAPMIYVMTALPNMD